MALKKRKCLIVVGLSLIPVLLLFVVTINDFLAISSPVKADILIVEGWIWNSVAMKEVANEFSSGQYKRIVAIGEPIDDNATPDGKTSGELAASRLEQFGVAKKFITVLPVYNVTAHRTYATALTLREWLRASGIEATGVNVFTLGTHARKSLVLFKRALGPGIRVGVIAGTDDTYDSSRWWASSRGIYVVMRKSLGFLYAVLWPVPDDLQALRSY